MGIEIDVNICVERSFCVVRKTKNRYLKLLESSKLIKLVGISNKNLKVPFFKTLFKKSTQI